MAVLKNWGIWNTYDLASVRYQGTTVLCFGYAGTIVLSTPSHYSTFAMINQHNDVDALLKARADIDEQLRLHKNGMTVLFTDVVGSTSFFERNGDTAGLAMIHCHDELTSKIVVENGGRVVKTIGDSVMAEFPAPDSAVRAAVEIESKFQQLNLMLPSNRRVEVRIGIHTGVGFRKGDDLFGDVVNVAARITKRTGPAQILVSKAIYEAVPKDSNVTFQWLSKFTLDGRTEKEDIFEVIWTDAHAYREIRERLSQPTGIPPRYEVVSQLGTGGSGIVYKVRDLETGELVALKMLKPELAADPTVQENFKRELCIARKITHKNVCRIYEFSRSAGHAFTTMELVEGESLLSRLYRAGALPVTEAVEIMSQMCAGLREAHSQGVVHRDLKPANIMIDRMGTVKIMDFGIARLIQVNGPMTGTIVGTPAYMAPEQAELKPLSASTDIYAMGLVLYEMITGTPAFNGDTPVAVALKQIREIPKRPREIIPNLAIPVEQVIMKCLQKEPANRYKSVDELEVALRQAAAVKRSAPVQYTVLPDFRKIGAATYQLLCSTADRTLMYVSQQNWQYLAKVRTRPAVILGSVLMIAGIGGAVVHGRWKHHPSANTASGYAQTVSLSSFSPNLTTAAYAETSRSPITSQQVDLTSKEDRANGTAILSQVSDVNDDLDVKPASSVKSRPHPVRPLIKTPEHSKVAGPTVAPSNPATPRGEQTLSVAALSSPEVLVVTEHPTSVATMAAVETPSTSAKIDATDSKENAKLLYLEVATFKDETWAENAVDKLTSLGFKASYLHRTKLWIQTYRVEVGPFATIQKMEVVRQDLNSRGYKVKPVN